MLKFNVLNTFQITKRENEWWTGEISAERIGVFPYNYVESLAENAALNQAAAESVHPAQPADQAQAAVETTQEPVAEQAAPQQDQLATPKAKKTKKKKKEDKGKMELAKVQANFEATSQEQLTLTAGQMILIKKKTDSGWWQGEIQGVQKHCLFHTLITSYNIFLSQQGKGKKKVTGWFPASYVKLLEKGGAGGSGGSEKVKALYDYAGTQEDELNFKANDIITLISKDSEEWWKGEIDGRVGVFPATYVEATE